jgi:hypothetical protein
VSPLDVGDLERKHTSDVHAIEMRIRDIQRDLEELTHRVQELDAWRKVDQERSHWFYESEPIIRDVVDNARSLRRIKTWVIGLASLLGGVMLLWQTVVWPFVKDHHR